MKHSTGTQDARPMMQVIKWVPVKCQTALVKLIKETLKQAFSKRSTSLEASPVMLADENIGSLRACVDQLQLKDDA